jgi:molybdopterin synthase sulfur carrier subunit
VEAKHLHLYAYQMNMGITVLFFGQLAEIAGTKSLQLEQLAGSGELRSELFRRFPGLSSINFNLAVNQEIVTEEVIITEGSTVALLPPFSGG